MKRIKLFMLMGVALVLACGLPTGLFGGGGVSLDAAVPAGELIEYDWGALRILDFHRPTALQVVEGDVETGIFEDRPARPGTGSEFVGIEVEFTCGSDQTICDGPPQAVLELVLEDGQVVEEDFAPFQAVWLGDEEVTGGATVTGWITFQVPTNAAAQALRIIPFEQETEYHGALPAPVDGFSVATEWETTSDGGEERELPALRRDMENAGFDIYWAGLYQADGETGVYVTIYTGSLFFLEDGDAVLEAQDALLAAVELWNTHSGEAIYLGIELGNDLSDEIIATVGAEEADIEDYLNGVTDLETFMSAWWVVNE
jgi:hypothetical protein